MLISLAANPDSGNNTGGQRTGERPATRNAADLIGASDRIGSIQPGRFADLAAVAGDPMADVGEFEKVRFVMKGGVVYKKDGEPTEAMAR